jgi:hypothetical protein
MISDFYLIKPKKNDRTVGGFMHAIWLIRSRERALLIYKAPYRNLSHYLARTLNISQVRSKLTSGGYQ